MMFGLWTCIRYLVYIGLATSSGNETGCQSKGCDFEPKLGQHSFIRLTRYNATRVIRYQLANVEKYTIIDDGVVFIY